MHKNESTFEKCFDHLADNNCILIFPEGISKTERRLRPIKTGAARIAFGTEEKYDFNLGLTIVPIGLNYSNPHIFKSDVLVNFGKPLPVSDFKEAFLQDSREAAVQLIERIKTSLEERIVIIENEQLEKTIKHIETLCRGILRQDDSQVEKGTQDFSLSQDIVKAVHYFARHELVVVEKFDRKITAYIKKLKQLRLRDTKIRASSIRLNVLGQGAYFLRGFPLFLLGFIVNIIPFKGAGFITKRIKSRDDFVGAVNIAVG